MPNGQTTASRIIDPLKSQIIEDLFNLLFIRFGGGTESRKPAKLKQVEQLRAQTLRLCLPAPITQA
jgi:hypothetical protein